LQLDFLQPKGESVMAKSKKSEIYDSDTRYERVLSSMALSSESDGDDDSRSLEFMLRKIIAADLTEFVIEITASGGQELAWSTDAANLREVAQWFGDAAQILDGPVKETTKSGLPRGRH
jgi:hypothetical protein